MFEGFSLREKRSQVQRLSQVQLEDCTLERVWDTLYSNHVQLLFDHWHLLRAATAQWTIILSSSLSLRESDSTQLSNKPLWNDEISANKSHRTGFSLSSRLSGARLVEQSRLRDVEQLYRAHLRELVYSCIFICTTKIDTSRLEI